MIEFSVLFLVASVGKDVRSSNDNNIYGYNYVVQQSLLYHTGTCYQNQGVTLVGVSGTMKMVTGRYTTRDGNDVHHCPVSGEWFEVLRFRGGMNAVGSDDSEIESAPFIVQELSLFGKGVARARECGRLDFLLFFHWVLTFSGPIVFSIRHISRGVRSRAAGVTGNPKCVDSLLCFSVRVIFFEDGGIRC